MRANFRSYSRLERLVLMLESALQSSETARQNLHSQAIKENKIEKLSEVLHSSCLDTKNKNMRRKKNLKILVFIAI